MARRSDKLREELAALDQDVIRDRGATRRMHKMIPIVSAVVALVGFGSVTWYAYNQGILEGSEEAAPYLRPKGVLKAPPSTPGGVDVPNRDKYVFNTLEKREDDQKVENLLPPPEQPQELPKAPHESPLAKPSEMRKAEKPKLAPTRSSEGVIEEKRPRTANEALKKALALAQNDAPAPLPPPGATTEAVNPPPESEKQIAQSSESQNGPIRLTPRPAAKQNEPAVVPPPPPPLAKPRAESSAPDVPRAPAVKKTPPKPRVVSQPPKPRQKRRSTKGYYIQLGALRSPSAAKRAWATAQKKHPRLLGKRKLDIERATVPNKGVYYRVQSGPMADAKAAKVLCDALKRRKQGCFLARRK